MPSCLLTIPSPRRLTANDSRRPSTIWLWLLLAASPTFAQSTAHRLFSAHMPLGEVGRISRAQGRIEPGPNQMIRIVAPDGVVVTPWDGQSDEVGQTVPVTVGLQVGYAYRFELRQIPLLPERHLYPTIELIDRTHPPAGLEQRHAVTIEFTLEDLQLAAAGNLITRVVYVEAPQDAIPSPSLAASSQPYFEVAQGDDPLAIADVLGRPLAIVRLGSRDMTPGEHDPGLVPSAPPVERIAGRNPAPRNAGQASVALAGHQAFSPVVHSNQVLESWRMSDDEVTSRDLPGVAAGASSFPAAWPSEGPRAEQGSPPIGFTISDEGREPAVQGPAPADHCMLCPDCQQPHPIGSRDEYVCDGGDAGQRTRVRKDWQVDGMQMEDTIAHFDTLAGEVVVVPSTRACVYAPRFAAVRQVFRAFENQVNDVAIHERDVLTPTDYDALLEAEAVKQPEGTVRAVGTAIGTVMEERQRGLLVDDVRQPLETTNQLLPFENLQIMEFGTLDVRDTPLLLEGVAAAQVWSAVEMAQVIIDQDLAFEQKAVNAAQVEFVYEMPKGKPRLRLIKLASEQDAVSGDTVHFTIRFDNTGLQPIGNVTIIDKLTTRLTYVPESQECTRTASFSAGDGKEDALLLRWEITEPLEPGEGGIIRFACRVD